jgi:hypothetical protein
MNVDLLDDVDDVDDVDVVDDEPCAVPHVPRNTDHIKIAVVLDCADDEPCCVCYNVYEDGELQTTLPCGHVFHLHCLGEWMVHSGNRNCPLDRTHF